MAAPLAQLLKDAVSSEAQSAVTTALRTWLVPASEGSPISAWGVFDGRKAMAVLSMVGAAQQSGALLVVEYDEVRVLLIREGRLVGVSSTVLFEQLGRVLYQADRVDHDDSILLVDTAERDGDAALMRLLPDATLSWARYRRAKDVTAILFSLRQGYYAWVEGDPHLHGLPSLGLEMPALAEEAFSIHQEWRDRSETAEPTEDADLKEPDASGEETVEDMFRMIREAKIGGRADELLRRVEPIEDTKQ